MLYVVRSRRKQIELHNLFIHISREKNNKKRQSVNSKQQKNRFVKKLRFNSELEDFFIDSVDQTIACVQKQKYFTFQKCS